MYKRITEEDIASMIRLFESGETYLSISKVLGFDKTTVSKYLQGRGYISPFVNKALEIVNGRGKCKRCGEWKPLKNYAMGKRKNKNGSQSYGAVCTTCKYKVRTKSLNKDIEKRLRNLYVRKRSRSNTGEVAQEFTISWEEFREQYHKQNGRCFYTDAPMTWELGKGNNGDNKTRLSLDRIDPTMGYTSGNVVFCTQRVNLAKSDFTLEEMEIWMPLWAEKIKSRRAAP